MPVAKLTFLQTMTSFKWADPDGLMRDMNKIREANERDVERVPNLAGVPESISESDPTSEDSEAEL